MSKANILSQGFRGSSYFVTFAARDGDRTYEYDEIDGALIAAGADPNRFRGEEVSGMGFAGNLAEDLEEGLGELAEFAEVLAL